MVTHCKLTRPQILVVLRAPTHRGVVRELAEAFDVSEDLIRHVRKSCRWLLKAKKIRGVDAWQL